MQLNKLKIPVFALAVATVVSLAERGVRRLVLATNPSSGSPSAEVKETSASYVAEDQAGPQIAMARVDLNGDPLPRRAIARFGTVRLRHGDDVLSVAFSPDGKELASCSIDGVVRFWDAKTGAPLRRISAHLDTPGLVAYASGGKELIVVEGTRQGGRRNSINVWDTATAKLIRTLDPDFTPDFNPRAVAVSRQGDCIAIVERDTVSVFHTAEADSVKRGKEVFHMRLEREGTVQRVAFSPDGKRLSVGASVPIKAISQEYLPILFVYDLATGKRVWQREGPIVNPAEIITSAEFSGDGKWVAASYSTHKEPMVLLDAATGKIVREFPDKTPTYWNFRFSADGSKLHMSGGSPDYNKIWDVRSGQVLGPWCRSIFAIGSLALSPDGKTMAASEGHRIRLIDNETGAPVVPDPCLASTVGRIAVHPNGRHVLVGGTWSLETGFSMWDRQTGMRVFDYPERTSPFSLAPDGKTVALFSQDNAGRDSLVIFDLAARKAIRALETHRMNPKWLSHSLDGGRLFCDCWYSVCEIDLGTMSLRGRTDFNKSNPESVIALAPFPDGSLAAVALQLYFSGKQDEPEPDRLAIWDISNKHKVRALKGVIGTNIVAVAVSPSGRWVAAGTARTHFLNTGEAVDSQVIVWDANTGKQVAALRGSENGHRCFAFSPDGRMVAAGGEDRAIYLWEFVTGKMRAKVLGHDGPVTVLAFAPDGKMLYSGSSDTSVLAWNLTALEP
jgi:WD40 repeat protein